MSLAQQEFTNAGRAMLGNAQAGQILTISKIVVGDGAATQPSDLWPLTALIDWKADVVISTTNDYGDGSLLVEGSLISSQVPAAFYLREVGVMAHIGGNPDQLYSVSNVFTDPPDYIDPAAPTVSVFKIKLHIDRIPSGSLVIQIGPSDNVVGQNIGSDSVGPGIYADAAGNVLMFKRLVQGAGITLTDGPATIGIAATAFTVTQDLDLYVPASYPGVPGPFFPTIQAAHDHLLQYVIPTAFNARIHVWKGSFPQTTPINITHPNASQIQILGQPIDSHPVTGNVTTSGALPNISVTLNMASTVGMAVNDVVYLFDAPSPQLESAGVITAVHATNIVVLMILRNVAPPTSIAALGTTRLLHFPTQIVSSISGQTANCFNLVTGIGLLQNFGLRASSVQRNVGVGLFANANLQDVVACNFYVGFGSTNGNTNLVPVVAANGCEVGCSVGPAGSFAEAPPSAEGYDKVTWTGCLVYGIWLTRGSYIGSSDVTNVYINSNNTGVRADGGFFGHGTAGTSSGGVVCAWNLQGLHSQVLGLILTALDSHNAIQNNTQWDAIAGQGGQISIIHNTTKNGPYSPANLVLGQDGGYIAILSP